MKLTKKWLGWLTVLAIMSAIAISVGLQVIVGNYPVQFTFGDPDGNSCNPSNYPVTLYVPGGTLHTCQNGTVAQVGGGGSGVTAVTGVAPVVSSGGTTPAISMHVADASDNGYLSSTDWNTFNSKQTATHGVVLPLSPNGVAASPSGLYQTAPYGYTIAACTFTTTTADASTDLVVNVTFNGTSVLSGSRWN